MNESGARGLRHPAGMYFVPVGGRAYDVTDEVLDVWASEELRGNRGVPNAVPTYPAAVSSHVSA